MKAEENEEVFTPFRQLYEAYCTFAHPEKININDFKVMVEKNGYKEIIEDGISGYAIKMKEEIY